MTQLSYDMYMKKGHAGQLADNGRRQTRSYSAIEAIPFGSAVCAIKSNDPQYARKCRLPRNTDAEISFAGDLVAGNKINMLVNGTPIAVVTFATNHLTTMNLLAAEIKNNALVQDAVVYGAGNRKLKVTAKPDQNIAISYIVISEGASQTAFEVANDSSDTVIGIAMHSHAFEQGQNDIDASYKATDTVSVLTQGTIYVQVEQDVGPRDSVQIRHCITAAGQKVGQFRKDDAENACMDMPNSRWIDSTQAGDIAALEINMP